MSANWLTKSAYLVGLSVWVVISLILGQSLAALIIGNLPDITNRAVEATLLAALGYMLALVLALGMPALATKKPVGLKTLGLSRLPSWSDIGLSIPAILPYYVLSAALIWVGSQVLHVIDPTVGQEIAFKQLSVQIEYIVAFITLVVLAPFAEELLFRGYFFGRLSERTNKWIALIVTSVIFGALHLIGFKDDGTIILQWGAAVDTFALAIIAGSLRITTGSIWAGVLLHALKNFIAYYFLFIAPLSGSLN